MKRRSLPNPIGLSVIDLFTCAFIAIFVLNLLADDTSGTPHPKVPGLDFVSAELAEAYRAPGYVVGLAFESESGSVSSWASSGDVVWIQEDGKITASGLAHPIAPSEMIAVVLVDVPGSALPKEVTCYVTTKSGRSEVVTLSAEKSWRAKVPAP